MVHNFNIEIVLLYIYTKILYISRCIYIYHVVYYFFVFSLRSRDR